MISYSHNICKLFGRNPFKNEFPHFRDFCISLGSSSFIRISTPLWVAKAQQNTRNSHKYGNSLALLPNEMDLMDMERRALCDTYIPICILHMSLSTYSPSSSSLESLWHDLLNPYPFGVYVSLFTTVCCDLSAATVLCDCFARSISTTQLYACSAHFV